MKFQWVLDQKALIFVSLLVIIVFTIACGGVKDVPGQVIDMAGDIKEGISNGDSTDPAIKQDAYEPFVFEYCVYQAAASNSDLGIGINDEICVLCHGDMVAATGGVCPGTVDSGNSERIRITSQKGTAYIRLNLVHQNCRACAEDTPKFTFADSFK